MLHSGKLDGAHAHVTGEQVVPGDVHAVNQHPLRAERDSFTAE
jgi:hypothetical protein